VQLIAQEQEVYVLARSVDRAKKEEAMRMRQIRGLMRDLVRLRRAIRKGTLVDTDKVLMRLGRLSERWPRAWRYVGVDWRNGRLIWRWDRQALRLAAHRDGAYLLRTNLTDRSSEALWKMYVQLTEVEAVFRALKSELAIRPIWHWVGPRVEAHVMVAFLGYCLWVCLKHKLKAVAPALSPWQLLDQFQRIVQVEVWFKLKAGGAICLPRITQPEAAQSLLLAQLGWSLPEQPPPKIYSNQVPDVWPT
jgi:transposase